MAWALVISTSAGSSNATDVTTTGIDTTGADTLFCWVASTSDTATPNVTDSKSNTWTSLTHVNTGGGFDGRWYYAKAATVGSSHTFSVGSGGSPSNRPSIVMFAFSGGHATAPADLESAGTTQFPDPVQPGPFTPSEDNCLVIQGLAFNVAEVFTINGSYSGTEVQINKTANTMGAAAAYWIQSSATSTNPTWTASGSAAVGAIGASMKSAAGGGGGGALPWFLAARRHVLAG